MVGIVFCFGYGMKSRVSEERKVMERRGMSGRGVVVWLRDGVLGRGVGSESSNRSFPASPTNQNKVGGESQQVPADGTFFCGLCGCGRGFSLVTHGSPLCGSEHRVYALDTSRISEQHAHRTIPYQRPIVGVPARRGGARMAPGRSTGMPIVGERPEGDTAANRFPQYPFAGSTTLSSSLPSLRRLTFSNSTSVQRS